MNTIINKESWLPSHQPQNHHLYILLTSLNLGGAEKIVSDQLWANYYSKDPKKITLIVIYEKQKEHSLPPNINIVRLNNNIENGKLLFQQIAYEKKPLVCHLINDKIAQYLFNLGLHLHFVIHNDKRGWSNSVDILNHPQTLSLVAVADFVKQQLKDEGVKKTIYKFRHHIKEHGFSFDLNKRREKRKLLNLSDDDILIGMIGRICQQKNYFLALDVLAYLVKKNPNYKLIILGGYEPQFLPLYIQLLQKVNALKINKNVFFPGFKTDAPAWLNAFDIGLNTSYFEGLSMATQEFMRNGLPMVLSKVCGQPEILDKYSQLNFFDLPEILDTPQTNYWFLDMIPTEEEKPLFNEYLKLVEKIATLIIKKENQSRYEFKAEEKKEIASICYGSHNLWNNLNYLFPEKDKTVGKTAFLTSNLNAGGAQNSLVNLLIQFKKMDLEFPLILLNQSNQEQYFNKILHHDIDYYLCHTSRDVFDISSNLFQYLHDNNIETLLFWNVDSKSKLLITKFLASKIKIIDVSPGDYIIEEMERESLFQESIYYSKEEYFSDIFHFVSKYDNTHTEQEYKKHLTDKLSIIPNGVFMDKSIIKENYLDSPKKYLVCGRISPSKHLDIIFEAWQQFIQDKPTLELHIVGSVEDVFLDYYNYLIEKYEKLIQNKKIIFHGHHSNPSEIMKDYDTLIVLGTHQGSPNIVLEAGAMKLPIIANDSGGTKEIINENTGILLPSTPEVGPLLESLEKSYYNYDNIINKANNCYEFINHQFSMETMAQKYLGIIKQNEK